ncbi:Predicted arabinose efflux permease, MFS family [Glycomyces sambucus]|uniref:Predicted arabinose efflux permease, MFS family n=1 Tax=Glycomyces sambucus TaxID=380244 RepID=A0A1G9F5Y4_9ACTN|nr:MFS transporter [Glycomyces sambucus]SDK83847.1 Predicted arabinose efflux permease, MFS family [Glycomyces sambucus]
MSATLAPPEPIAPPRTRPWRTLFAVMFTTSWAGNQFSPLLLLYQERQHYSTAAVNGFLGVYVCGLVPAFLLSGALSDRYGRRPVMFAGVLAAVAASTALAFGESGALMICLGRFLAGVTVGTATCVGTAWMKELSQWPHDPAADTGAGARRATLSFSLGSLAGAGVAGLIAQWGPWPEQLPFLIHVALTLPFAWLVLRAPETAIGGGMPGPLRARLRVPAAGHRRFTRVVLVGGPWVFAASAIGYGYLPVLLKGATEGWGIAYATLLTSVALAASAAVQPLAKRIDRRDSARGVLTGLVTIVAGVALVAAAAHWQSWPLGAAAAVLVGAGMGIGMVSGLLEVQRIAGPADLAGLTGVFYAVSYLGFASPALLAAVAAATGAPATALLLGVVGAGAVCALAVVRSYRRHLPR